MNIEMSFINIPITSDLLVKGLGCKQNIAELFTVPLIESAREFNITDNAELCAWLAQCAHESRSFEKLTEGLNYSADRLMAVWPKRFPTLAAAKPYANNPKKLANNVYANRLGNGPESSGDGYKYRGRGIIQITGKDNYADCSKALNIDLMNHQELLETPMQASRSAAWFWSENQLGKYIKSGDFDKTTRIINGGMTGADERRNLFNKIMSVIKNESI